MRRTYRLLAGMAATLLAIVSAHPSVASPHPRSDEWWFSAWGIESDVWPVTKGAGVIVAVLDTGVNAALPELSGAVLKGGDSTGGKSDGRKDFDDEGGGHGTGMAALIAGQGGGTTGFVGIAPEAKILPIYDDAKLGDKNGFYQALASGIRLAVKRGAKVINISQGVNSATMADHCESGIQDAIAYAIQHDVVLVASAGNSGNTTNWPELPASCLGVLAVGAIDGPMRPWVGTQRQSYVDVAAPGLGGGTIGKNGQYFAKSWGTSISAALTSGAVALVRSRNPSMPARTVVQRLIATARPLGKSRWNNETGYGAIQITSAMDPGRYPVPNNAPNPVYESFDKWQESRYGGVPSTTNRPSQSVAGRKARSNEWEGVVLPVILAVLGVLIITIAFVVGLAWRRRSTSRTSD